MQFVQLSPCFIPWPIIYMLNKWKKLQKYFKLLESFQKIHEYKGEFAEAFLVFWKSFYVSKFSAYIFLPDNFKKRGNWKGKYGSELLTDMKYLLDR